MLSKLLVESWHFIDNKAENAGAIYASNHVMEIRNWTFESNRADGGHGGSLYLGCPSYDYCEYDVYNNTFINNTATIDGGAVKWTDIQPSNFTKNTYQNNSALYGNETASFPTTLQRIDNSRHL